MEHYWCTAENSYLATFWDGTYDRRASSMMSSRSWDATNYCNDHDDTRIHELGVSNPGVWKLRLDRICRVVLQVVSNLLCNEGTHAALTCSLRVRCAVSPVARDWRGIHMYAASDRACVA